MFFKSRKKVKSNNNIILGMILLEGSSPFNLDLFLDDIKKSTEYKIGQPSGDEIAVTLKIDGELIAIGSMPVPIPIGDLEGVAKYAYNWENAIEEIKEHKRHLIVSIMQGTDNTVKRYKLFTSVICSLLRTNNAIGVYKGAQSLLISKNDYLSEAEGLSDDWYPLNLWIYLGLRHDEGKNSGYTYSLKEFGKREMEVVGSTRELADIRSFLYNIAHYVLENNVEFKNGQTCGLPATEKIGITLSQGVHVDTETFKLAY